MKKVISVIAIFVFCMSGFVSFRSISLNYSRNSFLEDGDNFTGSEYKGNYVWGGAMNLAWNELSENIVGDTIQFVTTDKVVQSYADRFNSQFFTKKDLNDESYYVKSGFGQKTVDLINEESKAKFPTKSFSNLDIKLLDEDAIAYAYFLKEVEYQTQFSEHLVKFNNKTVKGFHAANNRQRANVRIINYWNDDKFIISILLKDAKDQLIVAKGFSMASPFEVATELQHQDLEGAVFMGPDDIFEMPKLSLQMMRTYTELENQVLTNKIGGRDARIMSMFENIKFDLDHSGARVENEAVIAVDITAAFPVKEKKIKRLVLDKPFWVLMKRSNSENPYFTLGINNSELMRD